MLLLLALVTRARAQTNEESLDLSGLLNAAQSWAQSNIDEDVLRALPTVDSPQMNELIQQCEQYLQADDVLDLAQVKSAAETLLPLLDAQEETQPLAAWLRSRMDYFEAAEALKPLPPKPGQPTNNVPLVKPSVKAVEEIWIKKVAPRPWPAAAVKLVPQLKPVFAKAGVPAELVWLAEVESGFDARARSPAGAVGLFQLMPLTAKARGLSLWPFDERKQPAAAARAAAEHLRRLYGMFRDWPLAVAAYNCGAGRVQTTLKRFKATSYSAIASKLPAETQMYVPKVAATISKREGKRLEQLSAPAAPK
jgi:membrane-bound lytic murein transglycosylase D